MSRISLEQVKAGMVLADDVFTNGSVLLTKGSTITEKHLKTFKAWGVDDVDVEGVSAADIQAEALGQLDAQKVKLVEEQQQRRFKHCNLDHPAVKQMIQICIMRGAGE